jgi:hypothetical protein
MDTLGCGILNYVPVISLGPVRPVISTATALDSESAAIAHTDEDPGLILTPFALLNRLILRRFPQPSPREPNCHAAVLLSLWTPRTPHRRRYKLG